MMSKMSIVRTVQGEAGPLDVRFRPASSAKRGDILFIHGPWTGTWIWEPYFLPWFAQAGFDCAALSLRGHGSSAGNCRWATIRSYVADVRAVAATLDNPFIVGHSLGGYVAQSYVRKYGAPGVALVGAVPPIGAWPTVWRIMKERPLCAVKCAATLSLLPVVEKPDFTRKLFFSRNPDRKDKDRYLSLYSAESVLALIDMLLRPARVKIPEHIPLAVFGAARDEIIPQGDIRRTARYYGADAQIIPHASHLVMLDDQWQELAMALEYWLLSSIAMTARMRTARRL
jgi:pimeloyl-ACP methyl ester carboxylesterase